MWCGVEWLGAVQNESGAGNNVDFFLIFVISFEGIGHYQIAYFSYDFLIQCRVNPAVCTK
jgi:hypothetical protein